MTDFDIIIIGAGPAGMSAALTAANGGLDVLLLDEQPHAGGQIYRNVKQNHSKQSWFGKSYSSGINLVDALNHIKLQNVLEQLFGVLKQINAYFGLKMVKVRFQQQYTLCLQMVRKNAHFLSLVGLYLE